MKMLTAGIKLEISEDKTKWKELKGLKSVPDLGSQAEQVDVTDLGSRSKEYIAGLVDYGVLEFGFYMNKEAQPDAAEATEIKEAYQALRVFEKAGKPVHFKLTYPGGIGFKWEGSVGTKITAAEVNAALEFVMATSVIGVMEDIA